MLSSQLFALVAVVMVAGALFLGTVPVQEDGLVLAVNTVNTSLFVILLPSL